MYIAIFKYFIIERNLHIASCELYTYTYILFHYLNSRDSYSAEVSDSKNPREQLTSVIDTTLTGVD